MDLYQTDSTFQPNKIIDNYNSLVWTDRYSAHGDFELTVPWSPDLAATLKTYKYLLQSESDRVMMIETAGKDRDTPADMVKLSGRSLEAFLYFRDNTLDDDRESVVITGTPGVIINSFITDTCIANILPLSTNYNIPGLVVGSPPAGTSRTLTVPRGPIYPMVKGIADADGLGFKMTRTLVPSQIIWQVYEGIDKSEPGPQYTIFSPEDETLVDVRSLESVANYPTDVRVYGGKTWAGSGQGPPANVGWDRKYVIIIADDIGPDTTTTETEDQQAIHYRIDEIRKQDEYAYVNLVDGEIPQGVPHELGDIAWVQNTYGVKNKIRITEKIWTSDATGVKRIPTFEAV